MRRMILIMVPLVLAGCPGTGHKPDGGEDGDGFVDTRPPLICNLGPAGFTGNAFVDVTEEAGLTAIDATAFRLTAADINGDGYPDLIALSKGGSTRGLQRVYLNVPHPTLPGRRTFVEVTDSGIDANRNTGVQGRAVSFHLAADVDNDGDVDIYTGTYFQSDSDDLSDRQEILLNDGTGHFSLIPDSSSVATADRPVNTSGVFFDYDRDGILDLYVGSWYLDYNSASLECGQGELYHGNGDGTFTRVTEPAGLAQLPGFGSHDNRKPTYGVSHCDLDNDGNDEILVANYGRQWNDLWWNKGDGTFQNIGESSHFDGDDNHTYTDNEMYRCYCRGHPQTCTPDQPPQMNCMQTSWDPARDENPARLNGNTFGAECADFDNDGNFDVFTVEISHGWAGQSSDRSQLLVNNGGKGTALSFSRPGLEATGINRDRKGIDWNEGDVYAGFFDYDNDGLLDLVINEAPYPDNFMHLYRQGSKHAFREITSAVGITLHNPHALVLMDYDLDGDVDIVSGVNAVEGWTKPQLFLLRNEIGNLSNWSRLTLEGEGPPGGANKSAIGARVTVTAGGLAQVREVKGGGGQFGREDELPLTFGFGNQCGDLTVEVRWPNRDLTVQRFTGVRANYRLRIVEGQDQVEYLTGP